MKIAVTLRNMGPQSTAETMRTCTLRAESLGFESIWITDHIAIPPDDAEGSGGRYTDPLTTLAWLAGATERIKLGVGVLIAPYRPALPTAKQIATVQELSNNRLLLGVGVGWMEAEFRAVGVERRNRGKLTDELLSFLGNCFANEVVTHNGQALIFKPRPVPPPTYIGGSAPHALKRAVRFGHGWMPMARDMDKLKQDIALFNQLAQDSNATPGPVTVMAGLPIYDMKRAQALLAEYAALGVERLVCGMRYDNTDEYARGLDALRSLFP